MTMPVSNTIQRNKILTFSNLPDLSKKGNKTSCVQKKNMTPMTQLFLSVQSRPDADMTDFFRFENQREPLSLADRGLLRTAKKSDRFSQISHSCCTGHGSCCSYGDAYISKDIKFADYATRHIVPFLEYQITPTVERIDAIYGITSLKATSNHSRISVVVLVYGLGLGMATLKYQSTNGTVDSLKTRKTKTNYSLSSVIVKRLSRKI